jgi:hypothetical protein
VHRLIARRHELIGKLAEYAGRFTGSLMRTVPGAGGAVLLCFGLGEIYRPLMFIAGGLFLLLLDRRMS